MREGGRYIKDGKGNTKLVDRTVSHPDGDHPRDAEGRRLDAPPTVPTTKEVKKS